MENKTKHRILIFGATGFLGDAIYKELNAYYKTFGTYRMETRALQRNQHLFHYNVEEDDALEIIEAVKPSIIISAMRGEFGAQIVAHLHMIDYVKENDCKLIFLSSANVFDAYSQFPSHENDKTLSLSKYGYFKIKIENKLLRLPKKKYLIIRLPMVFGKQSPRIKEIKTFHKEKLPIETFPNLIMNVSTDSKITQQIHYMINRNKSGIYHIGSSDLVHHEDFIKEIIKLLELKNPFYKRVYTTNNDRYLAVLPKDNILPKHLQFTSQLILDELKSTL
jgi:dTDP-4-dehydrorhamnose reductase